jgi:hypothetical protein
MRDGEDMIRLAVTTQDVDRYNLQAQSIMTKHLTNKAEALGLDPAPDDWFYTARIYERHDVTTVKVLTPLGKSKLRRSILLEKRMRQEFWLKAIPPIVSAITGLIGTIIGLIALLIAKGRL